MEEGLQENDRRGGKGDGGGIEAVEERGESDAGEQAERGGGDAAVLGGGPEPEDEGQGESGRCGERGRDGEGESGP